jgi:putative phosphoribosyl transferase
LNQTDSQTHTLTPVTIRSHGVLLHGDLTVGPESRGVVLFAHGSGSSRHSPRNQRVAATLQHDGFATLLLDLLTPAEESIDALHGRYRFDIPLLAQRLTDATDWLRARRDVRDMPIGYFGASTGAGAALIAAAERADIVGAVVSRGGRPDLAGAALEHVRAPTLLIAGERDEPVIELNRQAQRQMSAVTELVIVPRATHLFEEPGALEDVARFASDWFARYLGPAARATDRPKMTP